MNKEAFKRFEYFGFNICLDNRGCGVSISYKKISNSPSMLNGFKIWKRKEEKLSDFIKRIKLGIKELREYPR
jgi:hypothetical protein